MAFSLPFALSFPYPPSPPPDGGYWAPVTSTLNWCEEDYVLTHYAAEAVNASTNLLFFWLAVKGMASCLRNRHDAVFLVAFAGYGLVGVGSFLFHSTLKYPMQLIDELSMIYTTSLMAYATFSYARSLFFSVALGIGLIALSAAITIYYHIVQDPVFHQTIYALMTTIVLLRSMFVMESALRPGHCARERALVAAEAAAAETAAARTGLTNSHHEQVDGMISEKLADNMYVGVSDGVDGSLDKEKKHAQAVAAVRRARAEARDHAILLHMWTLVIYGLAVFLGGFALWALDNRYCSVWRGARRAVGLPWGLLLEGHGWWHIMTGIGAYMYIVWGIWLRHCLNGRQDDVAFIWPRFWAIPDVVRVR